MYHLSNLDDNLHPPKFLIGLAGIPTDSTPGRYEARCKSIISQLKLCPVDVALWVVLVVVIAFICWFVYSTQRGERSTTSNKKVYRRLSLPYPGSGSSEFAQYSGFEYDRKSGSANSSATLVDPYHVVNKLDDSLIAKSASFNGASLPTRTLDREQPSKLASGLGLGIIVAGNPSSPLRRESSEKFPNVKENTSTPPPEYAHVRQAWWDS